MAYTLNANFIKAMSGANVEPVVHCSIALSGTTMDFHNSIEKLDASVTGDPLLNDVTSVAQSVDPVTRKVQHGEITLTLVDDGKIRALVSSQNFLDKVVTVKLGETSLALSDFVGIFRGPIVSILPEPGGIVLKVRTFSNQVKGVKTFRTYVASHPFEVVNQMLQDCGVAAGDIDTASFTPSNHTDISHYTFSSYVFFRDEIDGVSNNPPPAISGALPVFTREDLDSSMTFNLQIDIEAFISETMRLTRSTLITDPGTGDIKISRYNSSEAVTKHFTTDDYRDFVQEDSGLDIITEVKTAFAKASSVDGLIQSDNTAAAAFGARDFSHNVRYLSANSLHIGDQFASGGTAFLGFLTDGGQCGTRGLGGSVAQPADAKISADRPFYGLYRTEVLKSITAFNDAIANDIILDFPAVDHDGDPAGTIETVGAGLSTTLVTRPFAGTQADGVETTATGFQSVLDATMAYEYGEYLLNRFSNTCPIVRISVGIEHLNVEVGDLVSLDSDLFLSAELGLDGLDSSTKFEVTKREVTPVGDSIGVELELTYATTSGAPTVTVTAKPPAAIQGNPRRTIKSNLIAARSGSNNNSIVDNQTTNFSVSATSGLNVSVSAGFAIGSGSSVEAKTATTLAMTASKDTYLGISLANATFIRQPVANGAQEPSLAPGEVRLAKVVTDGSGVTSVVDLRNYGAISIEQFDKTAFSPGRQLIWNDGFGIYPTNGQTPPGWDKTTSTPGTDFIKNESVVYDGRYAIKTLGTSTAVRLLSEKIPVDKNRIYRASAFYQQAAAMNMRLSVYWWKIDRTASSTAFTSVYNANLSSTGAWQNITGVVTPPSDCVYASLDLYSVNTGVSYFNNASLEVEPFSFSAKRTSSNFTPSGSGDAVEFNTELHDHGAVYNTSNGQFTAPLSGTYSFSSNVSFDGTSGARLVAVSIVASTGGVLASSYIGSAINGTDEWNDVVVSLNVASADLVKGETVEVQIAYDAGATAPVIRHTYSFFSGREIR